MKNKNNLSIAVIIGVVIILSLAIRKINIQVPQAPLPSPQLALSFVGWQDVVNKDYGYRLKIPHDWNAVQMVGQPAYPQRMQVINVKADEMQKPHVGITITVNKLNGQVPKDQPEIVELTDQGRESRQLTIAGEQALFFDGLGDAGELFSVFIPHKNYLYRFDWTGTQPDVRKQYKDTGLKIMASLEFL